MKNLSLFFLTCAGITMLGGCGKDMTYNPYDRDWQEPVVQTFAPITSSDDRAKADTTYIVLTGEDLVGVSRITIGGLPIPTATVNLKALTALVTGQYYPNPSPNPNNPLLSLFNETVVIHSWKDPEMPLYIVPDFKIEWWHRPPKVTGIYVDAEDAGTNPNVKLPDATEQLAGAQITILGENLETIREINLGPNVKIIRDLEGEVSGTEIVVTIPDDPWQPGNNPVDISLNYGYPPTLVYTADNYEADNTPAGGTLPPGYTGMRGFNIVIPRSDGSEFDNAGLNEMVTVAGEGLNFINRITVEGVELPIIEDLRAEDGTSLTFQIVYREDGYPFPSGTAVNIVGYYHNPVRTLNLLENFTFYTDIPNVEPIMTSITSTHQTVDGGVYVNGPASILGDDLNGITAITVGGKTATMAPYGNTPIRLNFNIPKNFTASEVADPLEIIVTWGPNYETKSLGTIKINPILLGAGLRLGCAIPTSVVDNWRYQVLVPDSARVLTGDEFVGAENPTHNGTTASGTSVLVEGKPRIDQPAIDRLAPFGVTNSSNAEGNGTLVRYGTIGSATDNHTVTTNWLNKTGRTVTDYMNPPLTSEEYYSVPPYGTLHKSSSSTDDVGLEAPGTNYLGLYRFILTDGQAVWSLFGRSNYNTGSPLVSYRTLSSTTSNAGDVYSRIKAGEMTDLNTGIVYDASTTNLYPSHSRRNIGVSSNSVTPLNNIFLISHISYQHDGGAAVTNPEHILKTGYIIITNTSRYSGEESVASHKTWIEFDIYWPLEDRPGTTR